MNGEWLPMRDKPRILVTYRLRDVCSLYGGLCENRGKKGKFTAKVKLRDSLRSSRIHLKIFKPDILIK